MHSLEIPSFTLYSSYIIAQTVNTLGPHIFSGCYFEQLMWTLQPHRETQQKAADAAENPFFHQMTETLCSYS